MGLGSVFDRLKVPFWKTVNRVMAVPVAWNGPGDLGFEGTALFNNPTIKELVDGSGFIPIEPYVEYPATAFVGLKFIVDDGDKEQIINVDGVEYYVRVVEQLFDGADLKAFLEKVDNEYGPQNQTL